MEDQHSHNGFATDPALEDARRRFILSLRAMALRKEKDEKQAREVQGWMDELQRHVSTYRRWETRRRRRRMLMLGAVLVMVVLNLSGKMHGFGAWWWWLLGFGAAARVTADVAEAREKQKVLAKQLAIGRDPRAVSALAIACRDGETDTRKAAAKGLISILPQLKASDARLVTPDAMDALLRLLERWPSMELGFAILKGLQQVGDARAIPVVEQIVRNPASRPDINWRAPAAVEQIRAAADECLTFLNARAEQERLRHVLLRPAYTPTDQSAVLLRPAANVDAPEELLLRASGDG